LSRTEAVARRKGGKAESRRSFKETTRRLRKIEKRKRLFKDINQTCN